MNNRLLRFAAVALAAVMGVQTGYVRAHAAGSGELETGYETSVAAGTESIQTKVETQDLNVKIKKSGKTIKPLYNEHVQKNKLNTITDDSFYALLSLKGGGRIESVSYNHVADYKYVDAQYNTVSGNYAWPSTTNKAVSVKSVVSKSPQNVESVSDSSITPFSVSWNGTYLEVFKSDKYTPATGHLLAKCSARVYVDVYAKVGGRDVVQKNVKIPVSVVEKAGKNRVFQSKTDKLILASDLSNTVSRNTITKDGRKVITVSGDAVDVLVTRKAAVADIYTDARKDPETHDWYQNRICQKITRMEIGTKGYYSTKKYENADGKRVTLDDAIDVYAKIGDELVQIDTPDGLEGLRLDDTEIVALTRQNMKSGRNLNFVVNVWFEGQSCNHQLKKYSIKVKTVEGSNKLDY
jgi:hypothetical protein